MADTGAMDWLCLEEVMAKTNSPGREGGKRELPKLLEEEGEGGRGRKRRRENQIRVERVLLEDWGGHLRHDDRVKI